MNIWRVVKEVLTPGDLHLKAHMTRMSDREAQITKCLHLIEQPAIRSVKQATDEAAEFKNA